MDLQPQNAITRLGIQGSSWVWIVVFSGNGSPKVKKLLRWNAMWTRVEEKDIREPHVFDPPRNTADVFKLKTNYFPLLIHFM